MALTWICDRCDKQDRPVGNTHMPTSWLEIQGYVLCDRCCDFLKRWLAEKEPRAAEIAR